MRRSAFIKKIILRTGLYPHSSHFSRGRHIAILRYHAIQSYDKNDYVSQKITMPVKIFERQIQYFKKHYTVISMDSVADHLIERKPFPRKALAITFDDGYRDNYTAYKILKKYAISGTFYVVAGCVGRFAQPLWLFEVIYLIKKTERKVLEIIVFNQSLSLPIVTANEKFIAIRKINELIKSNDLIFREDLREQLQSQLDDVSNIAQRASQIMLTWDQIREMSANGMIIGGHTMTHLNLPNAQSDDAIWEINQCKSILEKKLQKPVLHFSYPNGGRYDYYNEKIVEFVKTAGFKTSTTSNNGLARFDSNAFKLNRIRVNHNLAEIYYQIEWEPIVDKLLQAK